MRYRQSGSAFNWTAALASAIVALSSSSPVASAAANAHTCSGPVFSDTFSGAIIDPDSWKIVRGKQGASSTNRAADLEIYAPQAIKTGAGGLRIEVFENDGVSKAETPFISGRVETKKTFLFGYFEFKARLPRGRGLWPALWLRTPAGTPINGEIDLLEGYGSNPGMIQSTVHHWKDGKDGGYACALLSTNGSSHRLSKCDHVSHLQSQDLSQAFHTYALSWTANKITWYLDGQPYYSSASEIPQVPMVIVMNLPVSAAHDGAPDESLRLPQSLDVQSVKVCSVGE